MSKIQKYLTLDYIFALLPILLLAACDPDQRWVAIYIGSCALMLSLYRTNIWIPYQIRIMPPVILLIFCGFTAAYGEPGHYMSHIVDWLCFLIICVAAMNLPSFKPLITVNKILTVIVILYGLYQYFTIPERWPASLLLHQNITSQFLAVSLLIQLFSGSFGLIGFTLAHIFFLYCRSIWVALAIVGVTYIISRRDTRNTTKQAVLKQALIALFTIIVLTLASAAIDPVSPSHTGISTSKADSTDIRLTRWENTIDMISANPLGVGPGNYEWNYVKYGKTDPEHQPRLNIRSPHNGYLELAVEWGIPALIIFLGLQFYLLKLVFPSKLAFSGLLLLSVDAIFAFPLELAYTFFAAAFFLGVGLKTSTSIYIKRTNTRVIILALALVILPFTLRTLTAEVFESTKTVRGFEKGCKLKPQDWQLCLNFGVNLFKKKEYAGAEQVFKAILKERPSMHPALRLLAATYKAQGKDKEFQQAIKEYKGFFK